MLLALCIFLDDEFDAPLYADPDRDDVEPDLYTAICETVNDAIEGDRPSSGTHTEVEEVRTGWRHHGRSGVTFAAAVSDDISVGDLETYLKDLQRMYFDEVDDPREPEREGVEDVIVDVIPPWEE